MIFTLREAIEEYEGLCAGKPSLRMCVAAAKTLEHVLPVYEAAADLQEWCEKQLGMVSSSYIDVISSAYYRKLERTLSAARAAKVLAKLEYLP